MKIIVSNQEDAKAVQKIMDCLDALLSGPSSRDEFIEPDNRTESTFMWNFNEVPIEINENEIAIASQFPVQAEDYDDEYDDE